MALATQGGILWCGLNLTRVDAFAAVEWALIAWSLIFIRTREGQSVQRTPVQLQVSPLHRGFHQIAVPDPVSK